MHRVSPKYDPNSCVSYVKYRRPDQDEPWGSPSKVDAYDLEPRAGLIVVTTEGRWGHAAYIESVSSTSMTVSECNYSLGKCGTRTIALTSSLIRGFR